MVMMVIFSYLQLPRDTIFIKSYKDIWDNNIVRIVTKTICVSEQLIFSSFIIMDVEGVKKTCRLTSSDK